MPLTNKATWVTLPPIEDYLQKYKDLQQYQQFANQYPPTPVMEAYSYLVQWHHAYSGTHYQGYDSDEESMRKANDLMKDAAVIQVVVYQLGAKWVRQWTKEEL